MRENANTAGYDIDVSFLYEDDVRTLYEWWTDLSGEGYVGVALKGIELIGEDGEKRLVRTRWTLMGFTTSLEEHLTVNPPDHWIWEPRMMGIHAAHNFRLKPKDGKILLHIQHTLIFVLLAV